MKPFRYTKAFAAVAALAMTGVFLPAVALGTPNPNGASVHERVFNDCLLSTLTTVNAYPATVSFTDEGNSCFGFANLHVWKFSEDAGATDAPFSNPDHFRFCADLVIAGDGEGEAGLQISPWWSPMVDGRLNIRTTDGEIACFGGRLPFYSFTNPVNGGVHYVKGTPIHIEITYDPNSLSMEDPATIVYELDYNAVHYSSGPLPFDQGNPAEGHGEWGMLTPAWVGGHLQVLWQAGGPETTISASWTNICFEELTAVPTEVTTWGRIKNLMD